jgi:hypothetical protein
MASEATIVDASKGGGVTTSCGWDLAGRERTARVGRGGGLFGRRRERAVRQVVLGTAGEANKTTQRVKKESLPTDRISW